MLSKDKMVDLLVEMLNCTPDDLNILEGCAIPMEDLIYYVKVNSRNVVSLDQLIESMFDLALNEVQEAIYASGGDLDIFKDSYKYINGKESVLQIENNEDIYRLYFEEELSIFESITGIAIN